MDSDPEPNLADADVESPAIRTEKAVLHSNTVAHTSPQDQLSCPATTTADQNGPALTVAGDSVRGRKQKTFGTAGLVFPRVSCAGDGCPQASIMHEEEVSKGFTAC